LIVKRQPEIEVCRPTICAASAPGMRDASAFPAEKVIKLQNRLLPTLLERAAHQA